jgi:CRISPR-associated protein Csb1
MPELLSVLSTAVQSKSILRIVVNLKPANADGLVHPPTYDQGQHIFRPAWVEGVARDAVLLDSKQSQANRIEMALLDAYRNGRLKYPDIELKVDAKTGQETYSVLELSHRIYDAALRFTTIDNTPFIESPIGSSVYAARADAATALFTHAPITLALGGWDSHGGGGPLVAKLPRVITSEIVGLDAKKAQRGAVKFDPMDIRKDAGPLYESKDSVRRFETEKAQAVPKSKEYKPSEIGLGNVPNFEDRGAVITEALQTSLISCTAARRLRFEKADKTYDESRDKAGRIATIALGLYGLLAQMETGYYLRSGCDLIPVRAPKLEVIGRSLEEIDTYEVTATEALEALKGGLEIASENGLSWRSEKALVQADERLVTLVERSRKSTAGGE